MNLRINRRRISLGLAVFAAGAIYFLFIFPTQSLLAVNNQLKVAQEQLSSLNRTNHNLENIVHKYNNPAYIDKIARQEYGLVKPGEFSYQVMPSSPLYVPPNGKDKPAQLPG